MSCFILGLDPISSKKASRLGDCIVNRSSAGKECFKHTVKQKRSKISCREETPGDSHHHDPDLLLPERIRGQKKG